MFVQLGSIIASNIYRKDDLPLYKRGNMQLFYNFDFNPCFALSQGLLCLAKQRRNKVWKAMTEEERMLTEKPPKMKAPRG